jgi:hypothetical protein
MRLRDCIPIAAKRLGWAIDEDVQAVDYQHFAARLTSLAAEMNITYALDEQIPDALVAPLAYYLAAEVGPDYGRSSPETVVQARFRVRAIVNPYERDMDLDDDGVAEEDEILAIDQSAYY